MALRNRFKLITFDVTNTILQFRVPPWEYYSRLALSHGHSIHSSRLKFPLLDSVKDMSLNHPNFGKCSIQWEEWWINVVMKTFNDFSIPSGTVKDMACELIADYQTDQCWCVADGAEDLILQLKKYDFKLGVISNFDPRLENILRNLGWYYAFDFVVTSYEIGFTKPNKEIFDEALCRANKLGADASPAQCLHIGDDLVKDYWGAINAGWKSVILCKEFPPKVEPPNPNHVYPDLTAIHTAFKSNSLNVDT